MIWVQIPAAAFMYKVRIILKSWNSAHRDARVKKLQQHCFSDVDPKDIEECFYAVGFAVLIALIDNKVVGQAELFKRNIEFDGKNIVVGGIGGVCVQKNLRKKGIASKLILRGLEILKDKKCNVACLNTDLSKTVYKLYGKIGFKLMKRKISFEDVNGKIRYDTGTMFILIRSKKIYDFVMKSKKPFHYGRGYW